MIFDKIFVLEKHDFILNKVSCTSFRIFSIVLKCFQVTRNLHTLMCLSGLPEITQPNLKGNNLWKRRNFNLRRDYLEKTLQEIAKKNLQSFWVSNVKLSFIFRSDLNGFYCRINWKIKIDTEIGKEKDWLNTGLSIYTKTVRYHVANF